MKIYLFLLLSISSFRNQKVSGNETQVTAPSGTFTTEANVRQSIGNAQNNVGVFGTGTFDGTIDDFRIYNRILTAQEVKRLYNMGHTGP